MGRIEGRRRRRIIRTVALLVLLGGVLWSVVCYSQAIKFLGWNTGWRRAAAEGRPEATPENVAATLANNDASARRWAAAGLPGLGLVLAAACLLAALRRRGTGAVVVSDRYRVEPGSLK
jgi:hypothetical protein